MTTVFLSGSRKISRINDAIRQRVDNVVAKKLDIVIGDANGADRAMQAYLAEIGYEYVTVYFVGVQPRNNVGNWRTEGIAAPSNLTGRDFYTVKDKKMAQQADFGLVLWDGRSAGSIANVLEMLKSGKKAVVYFGPEKTFYTITSGEDAQKLVDKCDAESLREIDRKVKLDGALREINQSRQSALAF
jgi:hypothetical protein